MSNKLFLPGKIGSMSLRNLFIRSATGDAYTDQYGFVTERQIELFSNLAAGGVGLIITGGLRVYHIDAVVPVQGSLGSDVYISGWKKLNDAVHKYGAKIAVQLNHGGRLAAKISNKINLLALSPSYIGNDPIYDGKHRAITEDEIWEIIQAFGNAAKRAKEAGFDAVQLHGAHGFIFSQFLSPFINRRMDQWGGNLENRLRFHKEVYKDIRKKVGHSYPLFIKFGVEDGFKGGLEFKEGKQAAKYLAEMGYDALEISLGCRGEGYENTEFRQNISSLEREAYYRHWCRDIKKEVRVPIIIQGGLRTFELVEEIISKEEADFISLCRPLIREPHIINEWKNGNYCRSECISCNRCLEEVRKSRPLQCFYLRKSGFMA